MTDDHTPDVPDSQVEPAELVVGEVMHENYQGEPPRFSDREWPQAWMGVFLDTLALMPVVAAAARSAGIARGYAYEAAKRWPVFAEGWREAYEQGVEVLEQHVHKWATVGITLTDRETRTVVNDKGETTTTTVETQRTSMSPSLASLVLRRHRPKYREHTHVEHSLPPAAVSGVDTKEVERKPTRTRILELAEIARRQLEQDDQQATDDDL